MPERLNYNLDSGEVKIDAMIRAMAYVIFAGVILFTLQAFVCLMFWGRVTNTIATNSHTMYYSQFYLKYCSIFTSVALAAYYILKTLRFCGFQKQVHKETILDNIILLPFAAMLVWAFIATLKSPNFEKSLYGSGYINEGFFTVLQYATVFLSAYTVRKEIAFSKKTVIYIFIALAGIIEITLLCAEAFALPIRSSVHIGVFNNSNHFGYFLAMSATMTLCALAYSKKVWQSAVASLLLILNVYYLFVSNALGANLAYLGGIAFVICSGFISKKLNWKRLLFALGVSAAVTLVIELSGRTNMWKSYLELLDDVKRILLNASSGGDDLNSAGTSRFGLWRRTIKVIAKTPWFGKGLDLYYANNIYDPTLDVAHNEYLTMASNIGIPGLVLYAITLVWWFARAVRARKFLSAYDLILLCGAFAYLISAAFGNSFTYTYPYFLLFFALSIQPRKSRDSEYQVLQQLNAEYNFAGNTHT
ncbi:MAG: O-antigen ligase family protein [Clostridia bacterium]|nr:O-antigen ligase family protein [Clostridia bacterium]